MRILQTSRKPSTAFPKLSAEISVYPYILAPIARLLNRKCAAMASKEIGTSVTANGTWAGAVKTSDSFAIS
ncbi:hypothetical protein GCM10022265_18820 [Marinobacter xestospongiae]